MGIKFPNIVGAASPTSGIIGFFIPDTSEPNATSTLRVPQLSRDYYGDAIDSPSEDPAAEEQALMPPSFPALKYGDKSAVGQEPGSSNETWPEEADVRSPPSTAVQAGSIVHQQSSSSGISANMPIISPNNASSAKYQFGLSLIRHWQDEEVNLIKLTVEHFDQVQEAMPSTEESRKALLSSCTSRSSPYFSAQEDVDEDDFVDCVEEED